MSADRILIVQRRITHYRVPLFEALRPALAAAGFELAVAAGQVPPAELSRDDAGELAWALPAPTRQLLGGRLVWQSLRAVLPGAQFVVLPQENKLLANWPLLLAPQPFRVALWGHGANLQARGALRGAAAGLKHALLRRADWAFAYTERSAALMRRQLPAERITVLDNAVDTRALQAELRQARMIGRDELRRLLGVGPGPLVLFIGSLQPDKGLPLLLQAAQALRARRPDIELAVAGGGPLAGWLQAHCAGLRWVHRPGPVHGADKARWLAAADLMLNPGLIGLGILDAFAAALPLLGCDGGPEIAYLRSGHNGLLLAPQAEVLADAAERVLADAGLAATLSAGAAESAGRYTLDAMVQHFADGLCAWRRSAPRRRVGAR